MTNHQPSDEAPNRKGPVIALVLVVMLLLGGILLQRTLRSTGKMEDCLMSGRSNCAPVATDQK